MWQALSYYPNESEFLEQGMSGGLAVIETTVSLRRAFNIFSAVAKHEMQDLSLLSWKIFFYGDSKCDCIIFEGEGEFSVSLALFCFSVPYILILQRNQI